jgi:hypothetical protein
MTDYHGAAPLPVEASEVESHGEETPNAVSDPGLTILADFCRAVIRAEVGPGWSATFGTDDDVCRKAYPHDPREELLNENWLPALFCWRGSVTPKRFEDGNHGSESTILCFWVFPPADEELMAAMTPVINGVSKALIKALDTDFGNGRHPSYVIDGDTDPYAATYGSSVLNHGGFWVLDFDGDFRHSEVSFSAGGEVAAYQAIFWQFATREHHVPGAATGNGVEISSILNQPGYDPVFVQTTSVQAS